MDGGVLWVDDTTTLTRELGHVGPGPIAVDTEADSMHHYPEKLCLVQLCFAGRDLLVDPLARIDLQPLGRVLADEGLTKIFHGADYDLRILDRDLGFHPRPVFDTMIAARLVGQRAFGLSALLEKQQGVRLDKRYQRADWSERPLPREMQRYAVLDTRHLAQLAAGLEERLERLGRLHWAEEEFRRLESVRWSGGPTRDEAVRRIKGSSRLDSRQLAVLYELHAVREQLARRRDRPPFRVLGNDTLLALAVRQPSTPEKASGIRGLPRGWPGAAGEAWFGAIRRGLDLPEERLPQAPRRRSRQRNVELETRLRRVCRERDRLAAELDIEPSVLASRAALERALGGAEEGSAPNDGAGLRRWQAALLGPLLKRV